MKTSVYNASVIKFYAPTGTCQSAYLAIAERVGGATIYRARGIWWSGGGELFDEDVDVIEICYPCLGVADLLPIVEEACREFLHANPRELAALAAIHGVDGVKCIYASREV